MTFYISIVFHIFGFTMLMGGIFLGVRAARMDTPPKELLKAIRFGYILAGSILVLLTGIYQTLFLGASYYFKQGWFHGKLTVAVLLLVCGAYVFKQLKNVEFSGVPLPRKKSALLHSLTGILFLLAVSSTILGRL